MPVFFLSCACKHARRLYNRFMCGRFAQTIPIAEIVKEYFIDEVITTVSPSCNIAPGHRVAAAVRSVKGRRLLVDFHWGLVPSWAKDRSVGNRLINARAETVARKPSFRKSFETRRCLVIASGFYEWKKEGKLKRPYYYSLVSKKPFAFAGLYDRWTAPGGEILESCTIITTEANSSVRPVHDRMPVMLKPESGSIWLNSASGPADLIALLSPYPSDEIQAYPVSFAVNSPANNGPECIEPWDPQK